MQAFKIVVLMNISGDTLRALALYVTYALHEDRAITTRPKRSQTAGKQLSSSNAPSSRPSLTRRATSPSQLEEASDLVSHTELGVHVLQMYADLLCDPRHGIDPRRFAKTVTNKVHSFNPDGTDSADHYVVAIVSDR